MNVATWLARAALTDPDRNAIEFGDTTLSFTQLAHRVSRLAGALRDKGLVEGDRVGILQRNSPALVEALLACFHAGLIAVPINARCTPREVGTIADDARPRAWIISNEYSKHVPSNEPVLVISTDADAPVNLDALIGSSAPAPVAELAPDAVAWLFYTSGTTGKMKGATLTHRNLIAMTSAFLTDVDPMPRGRVMLHCAPLTHGSGLYALPAIARAATQVITTSTSFAPDEVLELVESRGITHVAFLAPTMVNRLVAEQQTNPRDTSSLENVVYGGAPMYTPDIVRAIETFGPVFSQIFGQAEAPVTIAAMPRELVAEAVASGADVLGWVGKPYTTVDVAIRTEGGEIVRVGDGEILVRGDVVMAGYWENPDASADTLRDGWLHTGDIGRLDEHGQVFLLDRSKDVIISGGANVYPREVEEVLLKHPDLVEVAVVSAPDAEWGERVVAVAVSRPGANATELEEALIALCREHVSGYKVPRQFEWRDELPKSAYGKILKRELRDTLWSDVDRAI